MEPEMKNPRNTLRIIERIERLYCRLCRLERFPGLYQEVPRVRVELVDLMRMYEQGMAIAIRDDWRTIRDLEEQVGCMEYDYLHGGLEERFNP